MRLFVGKAEDEKLQVEVVLSKRNLLALLHKLDFEGSGRALWNILNGVDADGRDHPVRLVVRAEGDEEHYAGQPHPPGMMHPETERFIARRGGARPGLPAVLDREAPEHREPDQ